MLTEDHFTCWVCGLKYVSWAGANPAVWHTSNHKICRLVGENLQIVAYYCLIPGAQGKPWPTLGKPLQTRGGWIPNSWFSSETDQFCQILVWDRHSLISNTFSNTSCNTCGNTSAMTHVETLHLRHKWEHDTYDPCGNTSSATRLETAHVWHVWKDLTCSVRLCLPLGHRAPRPAAPTRLADRESVGGRARLQLTVSNRLDRIYRRGIFSKILLLELL